MNQSPDRLFDLLPVVYRQRDAAQGYPLRALLRVMAREVNVVEEDIAQLYENWFIETCEEWVVPYLGDLIGYQPVYEAGQPTGLNDDRSRQRTRILFSRREVANTIRYRRRKGTLALLEELARDVAGWPARAVEFYKLLGWTQAMQHLRPARGQTVDLRQGEALAQLDTPFDELAHTVDVRNINSRYRPGFYNIPNIGLFVWRLKTYSISEAPAFCLDNTDNYYTFSILGNETPLYINPIPEESPTDIAGPLNLPLPIRRKFFEIEKNKEAMYGRGKSMQIWTGVEVMDAENRRTVYRQPVPIDKIVVADLSDWQFYRPAPDKVAVDPELGRIIFGSSEMCEFGVWVTYHYGFSDDIGGGEYRRTLLHPTLRRETEIVKIYRVGSQETYQTIQGALEQCRSDNRRKKIDHAIIEITDNNDYTENIHIQIDENQTLQLRAARGKRPVIRLLNYQTNRRDDLNIICKQNSRLILDGLLITGRPVEIHGPADEIIIRHCTLVPGWTLEHNCDPTDPSEMSLELNGTPGAKLTIERSIVGSIRIRPDKMSMDPIPIHIHDSILDATDNDFMVLIGRKPGRRGDECLAHAVLTIERTTIFGKIHTHAIALAEDSIFYGVVKVGRRQGCIRFCYVTPGSITPRRYRCQPDLVEQAIADTLRQANNEAPEAEKLTAQALHQEIRQAQTREQQRVRPRFNSIRYGSPTYAQLADHCAEEIKQGAQDESEMGAFHDLYQPQRAANLRIRLREFTPAGINVGLIFRDFFRSSCCLSRQID